VVKGSFGETRLPRDGETGLPLTGFSDNWWMGLSLLHTLFAAEHNAVAEAIQVKKALPSLIDSISLTIYQHRRYQKLKRARIEGFVTG
jgi:hypothetical protein